MATIISSSALPRVTIQFCTQCKWMLRAAYFAQELLSTFNTAIGEVALQPSTGGTFIIEIFYASTNTENKGGEEPGSDHPVVGVQRALIWDRKVEGGFPETKELKRRIRDIIEPARDLGHVDGRKKKNPTTTSETTKTKGKGKAEKEEEAGSRPKSPPMEKQEIEPTVAGNQNRNVDDDDDDRSGSGRICEDCK